MQAENIEQKRKNDCGVIKKYDFSLPFREMALTLHPLSENQHYQHGEVGEWLKPAVC